MMKRVLIVAREFPPFKTIGRIRTVKWCQNLPALGWAVAVLTMGSDSREPKDLNTLKEVPPETRVYRAPWPRPKEYIVEKLKTLLRRAPAGGYPQGMENRGPANDSPSAPTKCFRIGDLSGIYDEFARKHLLIPDIYLAWTVPAIRAGMQAIKDFKPDVILASAPAFSDFVIAWQLSRRTKIPWVADYRDLWTGDVLREWVPKWRQRFEIMIERHVIKSASAVVTVSDPKTQYVRNRVPELDSGRFFTITNGYDVEEYEGLDPQTADTTAFRIVYTGRLFKNRRGYELLDALGSLFAEFPETRDRIVVEYYGGVATEIARNMSGLIEKHQLDGAVRFYSDVAYERSKALQKGADALLLIVDTGETTTGVIPGKLFEYIAAGRPMLCIAQPGATTEIIEKGGLGWVCKPGDTHALKQVLLSMMRQSDTDFYPDITYLSQFDRKELTNRMDQVLRVAMN